MDTMDIGSGHLELVEPLEVLELVDGLEQNSSFVVQRSQMELVVVHPVEYKLNPKVADLYLRQIPTNIQISIKILVKL